MRHMILYMRAQAGDHGHPRASARARCSLWCPIELDMQENHVDFEILSATAKCVTLVSRPAWRLFFFWQYRALYGANAGGWPWSPARVRARVLSVVPIVLDIQENMLTSSSRRSPLGAHFSIQANMATFLFQAIHDALRAHAGG